MYSPQTECPEKMKWGLIDMLLLYCQCLIKMGDGIYGIKKRFNRTQIIQIKPTVNLVGQELCKYKPPQVK